MSSQIMFEMAAHKCPDLISIIIPTFNEVEELPKTLQALSRLNGAFEIIVVDGGSTDGTPALLEQWPDLKIIGAHKMERAGQMNTGARQARGEILWFLHADTRVPADSLQAIKKACAIPGSIGGSFRLAFDRPVWPYRLLGYFTRFNSRYWTFGDQGIFVKKTVFEQLGGYALMPLLEDLELQLRLRKIGKFVKAPIVITTSARRYEKRGVWREFLRDMRIVVGFFLGVRISFLKTWHTKYQS